MPSTTTTTEIRSILTISEPPATPPPQSHFFTFPVPAEPPTTDSEDSGPPAVRPLPIIPNFPPPPSSPGLETSILSTTLNTPNGQIVQYFNVTTRATPPPLSAVKFAPLPELAPRKRKNPTPLGIRARGQMMARRRAMLAYGGRLPDDHPLNQPLPPDESSHSERYTWSEEPRKVTTSSNTSADEMEDPFVALGRAVKGVWKKMSNKDIKAASSASPTPPSSSPDAESENPPGLKKRRSFKRGRTSSNASDKNQPVEEKEPPPPVPSLPAKPLTPNRRPSTLRKSALVVADEADRAGAIAPLVHEPNENGGEVPASLDSSANSSDCEDDNWQTATIRPEEESSVTTTEDEDGTTESERERSRTSSRTSSLHALDEDIKTPTTTATKLGSS